jgi:hypothetical protein
MPRSSPRQQSRKLTFEGRDAEGDDWSVCSERAVLEWFARPGTKYWTARLLSSLHARTSSRARDLASFVGQERVKNLITPVA